MLMKTQPILGPALGVSMSNKLRNNKSIRKFLRQVGYSDRVCDMYAILGVRWLNSGKDMPFYDFYLGVLTAEANSQKPGRQVGIKKEIPYDY